MKSPGCSLRGGLEGDHGRGNLTPAPLECLLLLLGSVWDQRAETYFRKSEKQNIVTHVNLRTDTEQESNRGRKHFCTEREGVKCKRECCLEKKAKRKNKPGL